jgi:hypothetical protein
LAIGSDQLIEEVGDVEQKDVDMDDVAQVRSCGGKHDLEVAQDLPRLRGDIRSCQLARRRIHSGRAADRDRVADLRDMAVRADRRRRVRRRDRLDAGHVDHL